jgi:hypothetical protein
MHGPRSTECQTVYYVLRDSRHKHRQSPKQSPFSLIIWGSVLCGVRRNVLYIILTNVGLNAALQTQNSAQMLNLIPLWHAPKTHFLIFTSQRSTLPLTLPDWKERGSYARNRPNTRVNIVPDSMRLYCRSQAVSTGKKMSTRIFPISYRIFGARRTWIRPCKLQG